MATKDPKKAPVEKTTSEPEPKISKNIIPAPPKSSVGGWLGSKTKQRVSVATLASATGTKPGLFAALKAAYGWSDRTKLTRTAFIKARDTWLSMPASEV
jgi:hypothetical protein